MAAVSSASSARDLNFAAGLGSLADASQPPEQLEPRLKQQLLQSSVEEERATGTSGAVGTRAKDSVERAAALVAATAAGAGLGGAKHLGLSGLQWYATAVSASTLSTAVALLLLYVLEHGWRSTLRRLRAHTWIDSCRHAAKAATSSSGAQLVISAFCCEVFQLVFHNRYCGFLFRCGCTWEWAGGWAHCNVHNAGGPKCPWCVAAHYTSWTTDCLVLALMMLAYHHATSKQRHPILLILLPAVSFFVAALAIAGVWKIVTGYPYFLVGLAHGGSSHAAHVA